MVKVAQFRLETGHALRELVAEGDREIPGQPSRRNSVSGDKHYLYTLTSAMSSGSGTATIRDMADSTEIETGASVTDTLGHFDGLPIGARGICIAQAGVYYAITPFVTGVTWETPDLKQSKDGGSTKTTIDTAVDCP